MPTHTIGIIVHGATGRIGATQHLKNALTPLRTEGGLAIGADRIVPQVILASKKCGPAHYGWGRSDVGR
jgi:hypothetical protein